MALSNIYNEPRREITESLVGIVVGVPAIGAVVFLDYQLAVWFKEITGGIGGCPVPLGMLLVPCLLVFAAVILIFLLAWTHVLGDAICTALDKVGLRLRPTTRYSEYNSLIADYPKLSIPSEKDITARMAYIQKEMERTMNAAIRAE